MTNEEIEALVAHITTLEAEKTKLETEKAELEERVRGLEFLHPPPHAVREPERPPGWTGPVGNMGQPILDHEGTYRMMKRLWPGPAPRSTSKR